MSEKESYRPKESLQELSAELSELIEEKLGDKNFVSTRPFRPGEVDPNILGAYMVRGKPETEGLNRFNRVSLDVWKEGTLRREITIFLAEKPVVQTLISLPPATCAPQLPELFEELFDRLGDIIYRLDPRNKPKSAKPADLRRAIEFLSKVGIDPRYSV